MWSRATSVTDQQRESRRALTRMSDISMLKHILNWSIKGDIFQRDENWAASMDCVDPEIGQKQLHPESRSRGGEMQSINSFREVEDYQRWRPEIAWVELVWVILGVVGTGPLTIRGWDATCQVIPIMYFKTSSKVLKNLSSGFLTWSPRPAPNTRLHHSQCECTEEPQDPGSLHEAPQP